MTNSAVWRGRAKREKQDSRHVRGNRENLAARKATKSARREGRAETDRSRGELPGGSMDRQQAVPYVSFVVDDAGSGRELNADPHAIVRESGGEFKHRSVLVGWQCGFEPLFVAVHSYLDVQIDEEDAERMARDYLEERGWFANDEHNADFIIN